jgi:hypothetical protein
VGLAHGTSIAQGLVPASVKKKKKKTPKPGDTMFRLFENTKI